MVNYTVTVTTGDTYFNRAKLVAKGGYLTSVPDGGATLLLLVMGMFGLIAVSQVSRLAVR